jgi:SOS response regulatory protein OraA/RecX
MFKEKDYLQEIVDYIKKNLKKGYTKESLKWALLEQGYSRTELERAFKKADEEFALEAPVLKTKPRITYEVVSPQEYKIKIKKQPFWKKLLGL